MIFVINKFEAAAESMPDGFDWTIWTVEKGEPKEPIARSVRPFASEKDCRSDIATAKIRLKAARFARVKGPA